MSDTAYDPAAYGDLLGSDYDSLYPSSGLDTEHTADLISELAAKHPGYPVLEFGIGTGRLALALRRRGLGVAGIEASAKMVETLRSKDLGDEIEVAVGDYVFTHVVRPFSVVAIVFNNVLDPRGLKTQLQLFRNATRHLVPGGYFVVEAFVLSEAARSGRWTVTPRYVGVSHVELQMSRFDVQTSTLERTLVHLRQDGPQFVTVRDTYSSPESLDVMASVNQLERIARYSSWTREPFTATSDRHITIYERVT